MVVPKYVQEIMVRSEFVLGSGDPGYTIRIRKSTPNTTVNTFNAEIGRLKKWVDRMMPEDELNVPTMVVHSVSSKTHYRNQYAIVTIYDPIMQQLERYMRKEAK